MVLHEVIQVDRIVLRIYARVLIDHVLRGFEHVFHTFIALAFLFLENTLGQFGLNHLRLQVKSECFLLLRFGNIWSIVVDSSLRWLVFESRPTLCTYFAEHTLFELSIVQIGDCIDKGIGLRIILVRSDVIFVDLGLFKSLCRLTPTLLFRPLTLRYL